MLDDAVYLARCAHHFFLPPCDILYLFGSYGNRSWFTSQSWNRETSTAPEQTKEGWYPLRVSWGVWLLRLTMFPITWLIRCWRASSLSSILVPRRENEPLCKLCWQRVMTLLRSIHPKWNLKYQNSWKQKNRWIAQTQTSMALFLYVLFLFKLPEVAVMTPMCQGPTSTPTKGAPILGSATPVSVKLCRVTSHLQEQPDDLLYRCWEVQHWWSSSHKPVCRGHTHCQDAHAHRWKHMSALPHQTHTLQEHSFTLHSLSALISTFSIFSGK